MGQLKVVVAAILLLAVVQDGAAVRGIFGSSKPKYALVDMRVDLRRANGAVRCRLFPDSTLVVNHIRDTKCDKAGREVSQFSSELTIAQDQLKSGSSQLTRVEVPVELGSKEEETMSFRILCSCKPGVERLSDFWFGRTDGADPSRVQVSITQNGFLFYGYTTNTDFQVIVGRAGSSTTVVSLLRPETGALSGSHRERLVQAHRYSVDIIASVNEAVEEESDPPDHSPDQGVVAIIPDRNAEGEPDMKGGVVKVSPDGGSRVVTSAQGKNRFWFGTLGIVPPLTRMHIGKGMYRTIQSEAGHLPSVVHDGVGDTLNDYYMRKDKGDKGRGDDLHMKVSPELHMAQLVSQYAAKEVELKTTLRAIRLPPRLKFLVSRISKATVSVGDRILQAAKVVIPVNLGLVTEHIHWIVAIMKVLENLDWAEESLMRAYSKADMPLPESLSPDVQDSIWYSFQNRVFNAVMGVDDWIPSPDPVIAKPDKSASQK